MAAGIANPKIAQKALRGALSGPGPERGARKWRPGSQILVEKFNLRLVSRKLQSWSENSNLDFFNLRAL